MACSKSARVEDFFSHVPDILIDNILERLPIHTAARTSVLSKQWRRSWLSLNSLIFDYKFWALEDDEDERFMWLNGSSIISSILFHHKGPVYNFHLYIPGESPEEHVNLSQWLCYLSKNNVRKIVIRNLSKRKNITSLIFWCSELVHLELDGFVLSPPPTGFNGYRNLKHLELINIIFSEKNDLCNFLANCSMLATLILAYWSCMNQIVIDVPSLKTLILNGYFERLAFRNVRNLESVSVSLDELPIQLRTDEIFDAVNILASSCQIQFIKFGCHMCAFVAAGGIKRSPPVAFTYLNELLLTNLDYNSFVDLRSVLDVIDCCPNIKKLDISIPRRGDLEQHELDYNFSVKMNHLLEVKIKGITGSNAELKLIEYLLAISVVLEKLSFKSALHNDKSEMKLYRALMGFPRASTKARLVCLE